ncbi:MAG: amidohydrolase family protein, partial [Rhodothermales bacterium]|nr:amidohydrolase family protein [Rhodothermales bacterium]
LVVEGGRLIDPASGLDGIRSIGIRDGRIQSISDGKLHGERVIDASGLVVAPGFIDLHVHQFELAQSQETYALMVLDGVTSALELEVGTGDVAEWYREREGGQLVNYGVSVGHIPVRMIVMGDSGSVLPSGPGGSAPATAQQVGEIERLLEEGLREGALGVGFGLAYTPAATSIEFESALQVAAAHGASAFIHLRKGIEGLKEAIRGAERANASLHVVHVNSSGGASTAEYLETIEQARSAGTDITTEAYPYEAGQTYIESALFDDWESWEDDRFATFQWIETGERLNRQTFARYREQGGVVIEHDRTEEMTLEAIRHPLTMIASDGFVENGQGHPRTAGTHAKVLSKYVREEGVLTLMDAVGRMTIEPAKRLEAYVPAMKKKGRLAVGADADLTIFDPETVTDRASYTDPTLPPDGIQHVLVNGESVVESGVLVLDARPGQPIRVIR